MFPSQASCLPITALLPLQCNGRGFLLVGQGPWLCLYDEQGVQNVCAQIFEAQPIHGIEVIPAQAPQSEPHQVAIVVWGGRWVRHGVLGVGSIDPHAAPSKLGFIPEPIFDAQDWVLKVVPSHDNAPSSSRSSTTNVFMLTAHNTLLEVDLRNPVDSACESYEIVSKVQGPQSFLYAGDIKVVEMNHIIIASGTVFGEVVTWTCQRSDSSVTWSAVPRYRYHGHRGSIFGVAISPPLSLEGNLTRLMASCSDDRTIRVWDIGDCNRSTGLSNSDSLPITTGFGNAENAQNSKNLLLAASWGHASRIWNIMFDIRQHFPGQDDVFVLSRGEDATCQLWSLKKRIDFHQDELFSLQPVVQDRHHNGKNIWSFAQTRIGSSMRVCTGGADGQVILRNMGGDQSAFLHTSSPFKNITGSTKALKQYSLLTQEECLATTDSGELFMLAAKGTGDTLSWTKILDPDSRMSVVTRHLRRSNVILLGMQNGSLGILQLSDHQVVPVSDSLPGAISSIDIAYQPMSNEGSPTCMIACLANRQAFVLWLQWISPLKIKIVSLNLPDTFTVTACCYDPGAEVLLLGSRAGALAVYAELTPDGTAANIPVCFRHIHGEDSMTSIKILKTRYEAGLEKTIHILTTGRDGYYAVHCLSWDLSSGVSQPRLSTLHRSSPSFGPNVEGSYFTSNDSLSGTKTSDLILYGFRSTSFVVWNETQQSTLLSVECGGSHRSWSYIDSNNQSDNEVLETADQMSRIPDSVRTFVWTKAGNVNWTSVQGSPHKSIVKGGHGREIKAVAGYSRVSGSGSRALPLVATGAEDTNIQLFALSVGQSEASGNTAFQSLAVLKGHTTGLQHLNFSSSGAYLFSSAGCEEFYVWKLMYDVPYIGVGVVLQDQMPKEADDSDARIMSFDQKDISISDHLSTGAHHEVAFLMTLAYSNGKVKIVKYTPTLERGKGSFEMLREILYGSFCLMQASLLSPDTFTSPALLLDSHVLSAGTNGFLNTSPVLLDGIGHIQPTIEANRVHQSSILSMDTVFLGGDSWLAATGGDDNALGLTVISRTSGTQGPSANVARSLCIPKAHAAALTALKITGLKSTAAGLTLQVISVGNDQRLKVWGVEVSSDFLAHSENKLMDGLKVKKLHAEWTAVADVSAIELVEEPEREDLDGHGHGIPAPNRCRVMIVGVGMQLLDVGLDLT